MSLPKNFWIKKRKIRVLREQDIWEVGGIVRFLPKKQDHFCRVWILLSHSSLPNLQEKRRLFSYRMESLPVYRSSTKRFKLSVSIFCKNTKEKAKILSKNSQKGVAFLRMRHPFGMNATHEQWKTAPSFVLMHYICNMKEIIETMPRIELALIIIGVFVLILCLPKIRKQSQWQSQLQ